ncbi:MAG: hypothetical protein AAGF12_13640 [Myxococcota bacterium]
MSRLAAIGLVVALIPSVALAQNEDTQARALFEDGVAALRAEQFDRAADLLGRCFELVQRPAIAFNLGLALRGAGDSLAAMEVVEPLMQGRFGAIDPAQQQEVEMLSRALREHLGRIAVRLPAVSHAALFVDETHRGDLVDGAELTLWVEPGVHRIRAAADDGQTVRQEITVEGAERAQVVLQLPTILREEVEDPGEEEGPSPWLFIGIGGAVVAAAATVLAIVLLTSPSPTEDSIYGRIETLR